MVTLVYTVSTADEEGRYTIGAIKPIRWSDSNDHGVPPTVAPYMGNTHGRLILILVAASANSILFIEGRFLITCQLNNELSEGSAFF